MTIPTSVDRSIAPPGQHVASLFVQYAPYHLKDASWTDVRESFADRCIDEIARFAPQHQTSHHPSADPDARRSGICLWFNGGNIFQGAMPLHQLFSMATSRRLERLSDSGFGVVSVRQCGASGRRGDGGLRPRNAAIEMLRDGRTS